MPDTFEEAINTLRHCAANAYLADSVQDLGHVVSQAIDAIIVALVKDEDEEDAA